MSRLCTIAVCAWIAGACLATAALAEGPVTKRDEKQVWIEGVPALEWGKTGETTFAGAMASALAGAGDPHDYDTLMGVTAAAYRVRWYEATAKEHDRWVGGIPVAEQEEERARVGAAIGYSFETTWSDKSDRERHAKAIERAIASIDAGLPAVTYVAPHMDCAVVYGYAIDKKSLLVHDYYAPKGPDVYPIERIGPWFLFLKKDKEALSPRDALIAGLRAAVKNWSRRDRPKFGFQGSFLYGGEAWNRWIADLRSFDELSEKDRKQLFFATWWNFDCMNDARWAASRYLSKNAELLGGDAARAAGRAAEVYANLAKLTGKAWADRDAFLGPWTGKAFKDWTPEMRQREIEMLQQAAKLDEQAIAEIERCLTAVDGL